MFAVEFWLHLFGPGAGLNYSSQQLKNWLAAYDDPDWDSYLLFVEKNFATQPANIPKFWLSQSNGRFRSQEDRNRNEPIGKYLTDYPNKELASKATIRELLSHTGATGDFFGPEYNEHRLELRTQSHA